MTRADLMRGDAPWRLRVLVSQRLSGRWRAVWRAGAVVLALATFVVPGGLWAALVACWLTAGVRAEVWVVGGGRRPLTTQEWSEWNAHMALAAAEREHAEKEAEAKARLRGR